MKPWDLVFKPMVNRPRAPLFQTMGPWAQDLSRSPRLRANGPWDQEPSKGPMGPARWARNMGQLNGWTKRAQDKPAQAKQTQA